MIKQILATTVFTLAASLLFAQNKTYVGLEVGVSNDIYQIFENNVEKENGGSGSQLKKVPLLSGIRGLNIRQEIGSRFFVETGVIEKRYQTGIGFKAECGYTTTDAFTSLIIPIRFGTSINFFKDKVRLTPVIGYSFSRNYLPPFHGGLSGEEYGSQPPAAGNSYKYQYSTQFHAKNHSLLQTGLGLDVLLGKSWMASFSANYYTGFNKVISQDIRYSVNNNPVQAAQAYSTGNMFTVGVGLKYSLGFLQKRK